MSEKGANVQRKSLKLQKIQWTVAINVENLQESLALSLKRKYKETRVCVFWNNVFWISCTSTSTAGGAYSCCTEELANKVRE